MISINIHCYMCSLLKVFNVQMQNNNFRCDVLMQKCILLHTINKQYMHWFPIPLLLGPNSNRRLFIPSTNISWQNFWQAHY